MHAAGWTPQVVVIFVKINIQEVWLQVGLAQEGWNRQQGVPDDECWATAEQAWISSKSKQTAERKARRRHTRRNRSQEGTRLWVEAWLRS